MNRSNTILALVCLIVFGGAMFFTGLTWGLPSRDADRFLFGDRQAWDGETIYRLSGGWSDNERLGADVDRTAINTSAPVVVNETDEQRAAIILRYRLYTAQPDEMITFRALSQMNPSKGRLDPRLYQYGGLWVYPVGGLLKIAATAGLIELRSDVAYYIENPHEFSKFYMVARAYSALFGLAGIFPVYFLTRRLTTDRVFPLLAGAIYCCLPVVVNLAHEAKPHLPASTLLMLSCWAGVVYAERRSMRWFVAACIVGGLAVGMVISSVIIVSIVPAMVLLVPMNWARRIGMMIGGIGIIAATYAVTNPYVPIHLLTGGSALRSNLSNSAAMYEPGRLGEGAINSFKLLNEATGYALPILALAAIFLGAWKLFARRTPVHPAILILLAPALIVAVQFVLLAAGKPGEYARFILFPSVVLTVLTLAAIGNAVPRVGFWPVAKLIAFVAAGIAGAVTLAHGGSYVWHFARDATARPTRLGLAERLAERGRQGESPILMVRLEPAPYCLPPVDLWRWRVVLARGSGASDYDMLIEPVDYVGMDTTAPYGESIRYWTRPRLMATPLSWAHKPFRVVENVEQRR